MPTIVEFTVPADAFPLGQIFQKFPDVEVELERIIPTKRAIVPYFWVWGSDVEAIPDRFEGHPAVEMIELVDTVPSGGLFRGEWDLTVNSIFTGIADMDVILLSALGTEREWEFQLRADDNDAITQFQQYCREHDIPLTVTRLYALSEMRSGEVYQITSAQEAALIRAFEAGYFNSPREATLEEIAQDFNISRQSLADRLRRGHRNLIANTLIDSTD
ncbi:helix-turn-helix domain-containing protein [Haladaptatus halobius]|uniref:helix-turn-helix domain-containing protein n=1 Tax=Haladaptatus halobius TaxID=2884875 RepID=UPI001D0A6BE5|nr:helix-turn-helix domain-containing protein [Haladaptatus halobius]